MNTLRHTALFVNTFFIQSALAWFGMPGDGIGGAGFALDKSAALG